MKAVPRAPKRGSASRGARDHTPSNAGVPVCLFSKICPTVQKLCSRSQPHLGRGCCGHPKEIAECTHAAPTRRWAGRAAGTRRTSQTRAFGFLSHGLEYCTRRSEVLAAIWVHPGGLRSSVVGVTGHLRTKSCNGASPPALAHRAAHQTVRSSRSLPATHPPWVPRAIS